MIKPVCPRMDAISCSIVSHSPGSQFNLACFDTRTTYLKETEYGCCLHLCCHGNIESGDIDSSQVAGTKIYLSTRISAQNYLWIIQLIYNAIVYRQESLSLRVEGCFKYPVAICNTHYLLQPDWSPTWLNASVCDCMFAYMGSDAWNQTCVVSLLYLVIWY